MLKKYIDEYRIEDVPRNGIITIEETNEEGEIVQRKTAVSNLPKRLERDIALANKNGYYEYTEGVMPLINDEYEILLPHYVLEENTIVKVWSVQAVADNE